MTAFFRSALLASAFAFLGSPVWAANTYPLFTDINASGPAFGVAAASSFGTYTLDSAAKLGGNDVLSINQKDPAATCCHGVFIDIDVSNGENGSNSHMDGAGLNTDVPNSTPANPVFAAIGDPGGRIADGNVFRFSAWFRSDPKNPITVEPQVAPLMKFEVWTEALSGFEDTNAQQPAPNFGDRLYDQDQQGYALGAADLPSYVDINGDGSVAHDLSATSANGRLAKIGSDHWTRLAVTYTVESSKFLGIGPGAFAVHDVSKIESIKAEIFLGNFAGSLAGDGPDGGNLLVDNALVEVFRNASSVTPLINPSPDAPEPSSICLAVLGLFSIGAMHTSRKIRG
jgi:hypothetical protein